MKEDIGEQCHECGKIWTEEDEKELDERVAKSLTVEPMIKQSEGGNQDEKRFKN